jgi:hypothetical protein
VQRLGRAAEYKDNETGLHVIRMSHYAAAGAGRRLQPAWADDLLNAAPMHDVGKIGIPDAVPSRARWTRTSGHHAPPPEIGAEIIGEHPSGVLLAVKLPWPTTKSGTAAATRAAWRARRFRCPRASWRLPMCSMPSPPLQEPGRWKRR